MVSRSSGFDEVEHDAALAAVEQREERGSHAAERAGLVARGRLDLDHLGAELGEDHAASRAHHHVGHLDDPHALERQSGFSHAVLPIPLAAAHYALTGRVENTILVSAHSRLHDANARKPAA